MKSILLNISLFSTLLILFPWLKKKSILFSNLDFLKSGFTFLVNSLVKITWGYENTLNFIPKAKEKKSILFSNLDFFATLKNRFEPVSDAFSLF